MYWRQIFALDSVVVKAQKCLARMEASKLTQCTVKEKQSYQINILLDFSLTVKAAPHECVIRTSQP